MSSLRTRASTNVHMYTCHIPEQGWPEAGLGHLQLQGNQAGEEQAWGQRSQETAFH